MMWQTSQAHNHGKYENNGNGGYFRFDYDNNMSYRYILSITLLHVMAWCRQAPTISWNNVDLSSVAPCAIHLKVISPEIRVTNPKQFDNDNKTKYIYSLNRHKGNG